MLSSRFTHEPLPLNCQTHRRQKIVEPGRSVSLLGEVFGVGGERSEEDILGPVFRRLSAEDERYFREASEAGELFEIIEVLSRSFKVRWTAARLEEVRQGAKGTPASAVSDNLMYFTPPILPYIRLIGHLGIMSS